MLTVQVGLLEAELRDVQSQLARVERLLGIADPGGL